MARLAALAAGAGALAGRGLAAAEKLPLCDEAIVKETCQLIGDGDTTSRSDLEELTSATPEQCEALWRAFGYSEDRVDCTSLCYTVVGFLSQSGEMPAQSDTACYEVDGQDGNIRCDMDIGQGAGAGEGGPDGSDGGGEGDGRPHGPHEHGHKNTHTDGHDLAIDYDTHELSLKVANLFRIFPAPNPSFGVRRSAAGGEEAGAVARRLPASESFETAVAEASAGAIADIAHAIRHVRDPRTEKYMVKWFGPNSPKHPFTRKEILRILNSVTHVLANANYIHDHSPDGCDEDTYAFVMPDPDRDARDENGKFKVFLCDLFMAKKKERRETLTHEASHHGTAFTDDVCAKSVMHYHKSKRNLKVLKVKSELDDPDVGYGDEVPVHWDGKVWDATVLQIRDHDEVVLNVEPEEECEELAYGRSECMSLARKAPLKALRNADSFCFFIQDLATNVD